MTTEHRAIMAVSMSVLLVTSPPARQTTGAIVSIDPRATYLRTYNDAGSLNSAPIDLSTLGILPGDTLRLEQLGDFDCGAPCVDDRTSMIGVFSGCSTLLGADQPDRVPDAVNAGDDIVTSVTHFGGLPTDIPEDFQISNTIVASPIGATHLFVVAHDSLYNDNSDPDGDFAVRVTVLAGLPGDYNQNGVVDAADYVLWRDGLDTIYSQADYDVWRAHFGQTAGSGAVIDPASASDAIPEPAAGWMAALGAALLVCRRTATKILHRTTSKHRLELMGAMRSLISIGLGAFAISASAATLFRDDFNGSLNSAWSIVRPDASYYSIQPTYLDVRANAGDIWEWRTDAKNLFLIDNPTPGNFIVMLKVNTFAPTAHWTQVDILAYDNDDNHVRGVYGYLEGARRFDNASEIAGHYSGHGLTTQDFGNGPFWLQLRKAGALYSLFYSSDGTSYLPASNPHLYGDGTPAKLGLVVMVDPYQNTHALLDWFTVSEPVLGDYDVNGAVDAADYVLWRDTYRGPNVPPPSLAADGDGDGDVDQNDWNVWRSHFGQVAPPIDSAVGKDLEVVPEPAGLLLAASAVGIVTLIARSRRFTSVFKLFFVKGR